MNKTTALPLPLDSRNHQGERERAYLPLPEVIWQVLHRIRPKHGRVFKLSNRRKRVHWMKRELRQTTYDHTPARGSYHGARECAAGRTQSLSCESPCQA